MKTIYFHGNRVQELNWIQRLSVGKPYLIYRSNVLIVIFLIIHTGAIFNSDWLRVRKYQLKFAETCYLSVISAELIFATDISSLF